MKNTRRLGADYEESAAGYLLSRGYEILEQNYRSRYGEIDIIARDGACLVFTEVKYRSSGDVENALEAVGPSKQRQIRNMAKMYLARNGLYDTPCRFDVICLAGGRLMHLENAFE